ncbi:MAG: DUF397 domain-containing protein [Actinobacteria bacterium]|nr:DUF397 domain-containing protein [Actinomycetota bacterium]MBI3686422.1 DUF397 domain-containing protein [Actinomycetota bacterium]
MVHHTAGSTEPAWQKANRSLTNGACVEVAKLDGKVAVRDSKDPQGGWLAYTPAEWAAFLDGVKNGEFDHYAG